MSAGSRTMSFLKIIPPTDRSFCTMIPQFFKLFMVHRTPSMVTSAKFISWIMVWRLRFSLIHPTGWVLPKTALSGCHVGIRLVIWKSSTSSWRTFPSEQLHPATCNRKFLLEYIQNVNYGCFARDGIVPVNSSHFILHSSAWFDSA